MGRDHRPQLPTELVIGGELEIFGNHGMQANRYDQMLDLITSGRLKPERLIGRTVALEDARAELVAMSDFGGAGIAVIDRF